MYGLYEEQDLLPDRTVRLNSRLSIKQEGHDGPVTLTWAT